MTAIGSGAGERSTRPERERLLILVPVALAVLVFARSATFPFVNWDDFGHLVANPLTVHPLERGWRELFWSREVGYPAPLLILSYALDRSFFALSPGPYHVENVAFHALNAALLFRVAVRMRLSRWEACAVASVFALHPLVVEPVCWVIGRKDVLSGAMIFTAALVAAGPEERAELTPPWRWVAAGSLTFLSVLAVPRMVVGAIFVAILVCAMRPLWRRRDVALRLAPALPPALFVVGLGAARVAAIGATTGPRAPLDVALDVAGAWALQLGHVVFPVDLLSYYFRVPGRPLGPRDDRRGGRHARRARLHRDAHAPRRSGADRGAPRARRRCARRVRVPGFNRRTADSYVCTRARSRRSPWARFPRSRAPGRRASSASGA